MKETFEYVLRRINEQGKPSMNDEDQCMYRGPDGLKCAAGHLIPDDEYDERMEGKSALFVLSGHKHLQLIMRMQNAHDVASITPDSFLEDFNRRMESIRKEFNL